ncbi:MAG: hypothetical protein HWD92_11965 [Flavobacteriia bacterium]|nr:hypothetical protein [Flavobacteriia bacterium]
MKKAISLKYLTAVGIGALVSVIVVVSLIYFQPLYSPLFNSDNAIWVLMTEEFVFPDGLYYWGQDRLGSLLPILAHPLTYLGLSGLAAITIVNSLANFATSFFIGKQSKSTLVFLFCLLALFLPSWNAKTITAIGHPYLTQLLLLSALTYVLSIQSFKYKSALIALLVSLSVWTSELMIPVYAVFFYYLNRKRGFSILKSTIVFISHATITGLILLIIKNNVHITRSYRQLFVDLTGLKENWSSFLAYFDYYYSSDSLVCVVSALVASLFLLTLISKYTEESKIWLYMAISSLVLTLASHWVNVNGGLPRYFAYPVYLFVFAILIKKPRVSSGRWSHKLIVITLLISHGWLSYISTGYIDDTHRSTKDRMSRIEAEYFADKLEAGTLIGNYWSVYTCAAFNEMLTPIPYEPFLTRNRWDREQLHSDPLFLLTRRSLSPGSEISLEDFRRVVVHRIADKGEYTLYKVMKTP